MTSFTPSVDTTIFPRINFYKNFNSRAVRRSVNGRIFGDFGDLPIDDPSKYPAVNGSLEFAELLPFPIDLGPNVATTPTQVIDLRNPEIDYLSNPDPFVNRYDLNPLQPDIDNTQYYPVKSGADDVLDLLPFPIDLGPSVSTSISDITDLRLGDTRLDLNPLEDLDPPADGSVAFINALPFPIDLGDTSSAIVNIFDVSLGSGSKYDLNPFLVDIDNSAYYPVETGGVEFSNALPFPVDLGPGVTTGSTNDFELRLGDTDYDLN